jgi:hypothetical protein
MGEAGNVKKGPVGVGVRIQETMRVGPLKVEAVAAQVGPRFPFLAGAFMLLGGDLPLTGSRLGNGHFCLLWRLMTDNKPNRQENCIAECNSSCDNNGANGMMMLTAQCTAAAAAAGGGGDTDDVNSLLLMLAVWMSTLRHGWHLPAIGCRPRLPQHALNTMA